MRLRPPILPAPPQTYNTQYMGLFLQALNIFFGQVTKPFSGSFTDVTLDLTTLPTQAMLADLKVGQVYRDTTDNTLKVKT